MKLLLALLLISLPAHAIENDKLLHGAVSYAINMTLYNGDLAASAATTLALGFLKETLDPKFDTQDLAADVAGIALSSLVITIKY
jgi:hypothetical protein